MIEWDDEKPGIVWDDAPKQKEQPFWDFSGERSRKQFTGMGAQALATAAQIGPGIDYIEGVGRSLFGDTEGADAAFNKMKARQASIEMWRQEQTQGLEMPGRVAGTAMGALANLPEALTTGPSRLVSGAQEEGATLGQAGALAAVQAVSNIAGAAVPGGRAVQAGVNIGTGAAGDFLTSKLAKMMGLDKTAKEFEESATNPETLAVYGVMGAAFPPNVKAKKADKALDNLKAIAETKKAEPPKVEPRELTNETSQLDLFDQPEMGRVANPYEAKLGDWRIDENGIPIKADLSMELQNLQNPLQGNLWGDELTPTRNPVGQSATMLDENGMQMEPRGLTDAIDSMPPAERTAAINERMVGEINDGPLKAAAMAAENPKFVPKSQRGIISPDLLGIGKVFDWIDKLGEAKVLDKFKGAFAHVDLSIKNAKDPTGNTDLVLMEPDRFKRLAYPYEPGFDEHHEVLRQSIREGLKSDRGLTDIPIIRVSPDGKVIGHEGRHRMDVFLEQGVDKIPVEIVWEKYDKNGQLERFVKPKANEYPTHLINEKGDELVEFPHKPIDFGKPGVPSKQRGGAKGTWNPFAVKKAVTDAVENTMDILKKGFPKSTEQHKQDAVNRIPGMRDISYVTEDIPLNEQTKAQILAEPDGPGLLGRNLSPGRVMTQELWKSTLVKNVGRALENARNRWSSIMDNEVKPMKATLNKLMNRTEEGKMFHGIFMQELQNGRRFTPEELRQAGMTDLVIDGYMRMRDNLDKVIDAQNESLLAKGKKPVTPMDAYMSARWVGPWHAIVKDANGKVVWYISERSALGRKRAVDWIKKNAPDLKITDMKYDATYSPKNRDLISAYKSMIDLLGPEDPAVQRVEQLLKQLATMETVNVAGQEQHFKTKTGVKGYAGERPWAKGDYKDFIEQQLQYIENGYLWAEQQKALELAKTYLDDAEINAKQPNNVKYVKDLVKAELGIGTLAEVTAMEDALGKYTGWNPNAYARGLGISKSIFYMKQLGLNIPFMTISLLQPSLVFMSAHTHAGTNLMKGIAGAAVNGPAMAIRQLLQDVMALNQMTSHIDLDTKFPFSDEFSRDAYEYARTNRVTELNQLSDTRDISMPRSIVALERTVGATISVPELVSRSIMYMSFVEGLKGKYDTTTKAGRLELFQKAAELVKFSMGDYDPTQKPLAYQKAGMAGNALFTLQTFIFNQLAQTYAYGKDFAAGKPMPLMSYLFSMWAFAGAMGMTGVDDIEELWNTIKRSVPDSVYAKIKDMSPKGFMVENLPEVASYGLASKISGTNIYTRASMGDVLNLGMFESDASTMMESYLPFITTMMKDAGAAASLLTDPTADEARQAAYQLTPSGFRGVFEEKVPGMKQKDLALQPSDLSKGLVRRGDEKSKNLRELGFRSLKEQKEIDRGFAQRTQDKINETRRVEVAKKFLSSVTTGDKNNIVKYLDRYIEFDGDVDALANRIPTAYKNRLFTSLEREVLKLDSKSPAQVKKAMKYQEILNSLK